MTDKKTAFLIAVVTTAAAVLLFGTARHFASIDQLGTNQSAASPEIAELPNPALSRVRLLVSHPN